MGDPLSGSDAPNSVPNDDGLKTSKNNRGRGTRTLYHHYSSKHYITEILTSYKWPIVVLLVVVLVLLAWRGVPSIPSLPPEAWSALIYAGIGCGIATPLGWILLKRWQNVEGVEVLDTDPITGEHRHLRIGPELFSQIRVLSPWGGEASVEDLARCSINGRPGYEMMDLRIDESGRPVCVSTFVGEANASALRTYRYALIYARRRLSKQAAKAQVLEANREHIIREIAERQTAQMIMRSEESGLPDGSSIQQTVDDVLEDLGMDDRLLDDVDDLDDDLDQLEEFKEISSMSGERAEHLNGESESEMLNLIGGEK